MPRLDLLRIPARQAATVHETGHRPWPLPRGPWVFGQTLADVLFAHWHVPAETLRAHVPDGLRLDEFDGSAWLGIVLFEVTGLRARGTLPLPYVSSFRQLNVRTYVTCEDRPGVWFFSLDASGRLAVEAARRVYRLPSFHARLSLERRRGRFLFECVRDERAAFSGSYAPTGGEVQARRGSLERFLMERYRLYAKNGERLFRTEIHHRPWLLRSADATIDLNTMPPSGVKLDGEPVVHCSPGQDILLWPLQPLET